MGGHKAAVTKLQVLGSKEENGHDLLLSAGADGSVAVWEPSSAAPAGPDKERLPKVPSLMPSFTQTGARGLQATSPLCDYSKHLHVIWWYVAACLQRE